MLRFCPFGAAPLHFPPLPRHSWKTARDDGVGSGGNMRFPVQKHRFWPSHISKIADKFLIEYIPEIIWKRDNTVDKYYPEFIQLFGGTLDI